MWLKREDYERLVTQAAQLKPLQNVLAVAEERASNAEDLLASERQAKDWLITQLTSRFLTKQGSYGLDHERSVEGLKEALAETPKAYKRQPTERDLGLLEFYKQCAAQTGQPEEDAIAKWEAVMRGERSELEADADSQVEN